jgi:hypothetical protein
MDFWLGGEKYKKLFVNKILCGGMELLFKSVNDFSRKEFPMLLLPGHSKKEDCQFTTSFFRSVPAPVFNAAV